MLAAIIAALAITMDGSWSETQEHVILSKVPEMVFVKSSHPSVGASILGFHGLRPDKLPRVAFVASVAAHMYRCAPCEEGADVWDIRGGLLSWARVNFARLDVLQRCQWTDHQTDATLLPRYCEEIKHQRPVLVTIAWGNRCRESLREACRTQWRFSAMGIGYCRYGEGKREGSSDQPAMTDDNSNVGLELILSVPSAELPQNEKVVWEKFKPFLRQYEGAPDRQAWYICPSSLPESNLVFTFIQPAP